MFLQLYGVALVDLGLLLASKDTSVDDIII